FPVAFRSRAAHLRGGRGMRREPRRCLSWGTATAVAVAWSLVAVSFADEPTRPTATASEANPAVPAAGHSVHGEAFDDGPRHGGSILPGMGEVRFPVTAARPQAQEFIAQGVAQLHSFYYFESERCFRQAALIDPGCAMAYWGSATSTVHNDQRARGFVQAARKRAAKVTTRERRYIEALEAFYKDRADDKARRQGLLH